MTARELAHTAAIVAGATLGTLAGLVGGIILTLCWYVTRQPNTDPWQKRDPWWIELADRCTACKGRGYTEHENGIHSVPCKNCGTSGLKPATP